MPEGIWSRYPIQLNVDNIVEAEGDVDVQVQNGWMELKCGKMPARKKTVLVVNGGLAILLRARRNF